ncbi:MAG: UDP-N-acetylmuramoyl-L-alanyl-D-glutamate--2,6-diaminopimelate ligase [Clostridia bacterium]|nr:UDP-N-acetylmuramoyl-L-alanyl-D-glutamate--2,6-diaminopimelate ligase [Clostridia bacterium]
MKLKELYPEVPYILESRGDLDTEFNAVVDSSRTKSDRGIFFCVNGARFDAHDFAPEAVKNGCVALVVERFVDEVDVPQLLVSDVRAAMARICATFYGWPSRKMKMIGITGTKGKTTTSYMCKAIFEAAGYTVGLIGTTGTIIGDRKIASHLTTPDPVELQKMLHDMVEAGVEVVCMEVSAHAIDMHRLDGMVFDVGCYTNLSQDHLDYFHTMDRYFECKKSFFTSGQVLNATVNGDDETAKKLEAELDMPHISYGIVAPSDVFAKNIERSENGTNFDILLHSMNNVHIELPMSGSFSIYNALAAASVAMILGVPSDKIASGLDNMRAVPGRIEMLQTGTPYKVILDYSHSPDALKNILQTVKEFTKNRVIVLFGCGGDRDHGKRPMMGSIAGRMADYCILTSDNPRSEDPRAILDSIEEGIRPTGSPYVVIENRREAIRYALNIGREGDVIILAGKGHETYQEIQGVKYPFDEKVVVQELLQEQKALNAIRETECRDASANS